MKKILRWLPATILLILFGLLWGTAVSGGVKGMLAYNTLMSATPYLGGFTFLGIVVLLVVKRKLTAPLLATCLVSLLLIWPFLWQSNILAVAYPSSLENTAPAATVRLPANEPILIIWGGDSPRVNKHTTNAEQRWAYDLAVEPALTLSNQLEDYGCWGVPVVAPAAGEIIVAQDGEPDHTPGRDSVGFTHPAGNHVYIRLETDTYLAIAHLEQGSVVVQEGDIVSEGQVLASCGNSGSTFEPHIHIHHQRQDPRLVPFDFAEGLPLYFRDHDGPPMPQGGVRLEDGNVIALGERVQHIGK